VFAQTRGNEAGVAGVTVTGAASGIGRACAEALVSDGAAMVAAVAAADRFPAAETY
jgi:NAD(P)-dependent dehydrogenase (short-subunit alcohol dehydrogenase family)